MRKSGFPAFLEESEDMATPSLSSLSTSAGPERWLPYRRHMYNTFLIQPALLVYFCPLYVPGSKTHQVALQASSITYFTLFLSTVFYSPQKFYSCT